MIDICCLKEALFWAIIGTQQAWATVLKLVEREFVGGRPVDVDNDKDR